MRPDINRWWTLLVIGLLCGACRPLPLYPQPTLDQPNALVKLRMINHSSPDIHFSQFITASKHDKQYRIPIGPEDTIVAIRAIPDDEQAWAFRSRFSHTEYYTATESYTYACGGGKTYQTCTSTRTVTRSREVTTAQCEQTASYRFSPNEVYLLQYDFYDNDQCSLVCLVQRASGNADGPTNAPCP